MRSDCTRRSHAAAHCCPLIPIRRLKCEVQVFIYHREEPQPGFILVKPAPPENSRTLLNSDHPRFRACQRSIDLRTMQQQQYGQPPQGMAPRGGWRRVRKLLGDRGGSIPPPARDLVHCPRHAARALCAGRAGVCQRSNKRLGLPMWRADDVVCHFRRTSDAGGATNAADGPDEHGRRFASLIFSRDRKLATRLLTCSTQQTWI